MTIKQKLNSYLTDEVYITELKRAVILDILDQEDPKAYIKEVLEHGCISGIVAGLIYYADSLPFAKKHFDDIVDIYQLQADDLGKDNMPNPMLESSPLNWIAWYGYEETVRELADELDIIY